MKDEIEEESNNSSLNKGEMGPVVPFTHFCSYFDANIQIVQG